MGKLYAKKLDTDESPKEVNVEAAETPVATPNEKRLKALEKARERRQQKKAEAEAAKKAQEEAEAEAKRKEEEAFAEKQKKKEAAAEKRRQARLAKKTQEPTPSVASVEQPSEPAPEPSEPVKKERKRRVSKKVTSESVGSDQPTVDEVEPKRRKVDSNEPPKWFTTFMEGVKKEQMVQSGEKKSKADIKAEVQEHASKAWNDGYTRDRIQNEQDKHLGRMYSMMFSGRKM